MKKLSLIAWLLVILLAIPSWALAASVYYMTAGDSAQDAAIMNALTSHYTVTTGVNYTAFDGSQATLSNYNVVLFSASSVGICLLAGQTALKNFVMAGGGLVTGEWVCGGRLLNWSDWGTSPSFAILNDVLPGQSIVTTDTSLIPSSNYTQATINPVLNYHVTSSFNFPVTDYYGMESNISAKTGATIYYTSSTFPGFLAPPAWWAGATALGTWAGCWTFPPASARMS